jgi:hypothetical protein
LLAAARKGDQQLTLESTKTRADGLQQPQSLEHALAGKHPRSFRACERSRNAHERTVLAQGEKRMASVSFSQHSAVIGPVKA